MKFAYFNPTTIAVDEVPADKFSLFKSMVDQAHQFSDKNDAGNPKISVRGGQQIQLLPNDFGMDVSGLKQYVEGRCQEYVDTVMKQASKNDLQGYQPVMVSAWTIRQTTGDYQAMHSHEAHISGNIYIEAPDLADPNAPSDAKIEFRFPTIRNAATFTFIDQWRFSPQPMKMLVFPSYLPHCVYPWKGSGYRTILAWDCKLIPKKA